MSSLVNVSVLKCVRLRDVMREVYAHSFVFQLAVKYSLYRSAMPTALYDSSTTSIHMVLQRRYP